MLGDAGPSGKRDTNLRYVLEQSTVIRIAIPSKSPPEMLVRCLVGHHKVRMKYSQTSHKPSCHKCVDDQHYCYWLSANGLPEGMLMIF